MSNSTRKFCRDAPKYSLVRLQTIIVKYNHNDAVDDNTIVSSVVCRSKVMSRWYKHRNVVQFELYCSSTIVNVIFVFAENARKV
jgi:hypothetical protein